MLSHEPSVNSVREKGEALLELVQDQTLKDKVQKLQSDFQDLCSVGKVRGERGTMSADLPGCDEGSLPPSSPLETSEDRHESEAH